MGGEEIVAVVVMLESKEGVGVMVGAVVASGSAVWDHVT